MVIAVQNLQRKSCASILKVNDNGALCECVGKAHPEKNEIKVLGKIVRKW